MENNDIKLNLFLSFCTLGGLTTATLMPQGKAQEIVTTTSQFLETHKINEATKNNISQIFLEIVNRHVSKQFIERLTTYLKTLNKEEKEIFSHFFKSLDSLKYESVENNAHLSTLLKADLNQLGISPAVSDYIIYGTYFIKGRDLGNHHYMRDASTYLEKSAQAGFTKAILEWTEGVLNCQPSSREKVQECVRLLRNIDAYRSNKDAMILLSRITILYQYEHLTGLSLEEALKTVFENRVYIIFSYQTRNYSDAPLGNALRIFFSYRTCISSSVDNLQALLEAGLIYLSAPDIQHSADKGMILLQEYVKESNNIGDLLKLIYIADKQYHHMNNISALCICRINEIASYSNTGLTLSGPTFLLEKNDAFTITNPNGTEEFIKYYLEKMSKQMKGKQLNIRSFFFNT